MRVSKTFLPAFALIAGLALNSSSAFAAGTASPSATPSTSAKVTYTKNYEACNILAAQTSYAQDYSTVGLWIQGKKTSDQAGKAMQNIATDFITVSKIATPPLSTYFSKEADAFHTLFNDFLKKDGKAWTADTKTMVKYRDLAFAICAKTKK